MVPAAGHQRAAPSPAAVYHAGLDALPLGAPVLKPDLDLYLAEAQLAGDHRALGQRQVLLAVELLLQFEQLVAGERRAAPTVAAARRDRGSARRRRQARRGLGVRRWRARRTVHVDDAAARRRPAAVGLCRR